MYKILVDSIESYVDGANVPKILANVSAWYSEKLIPDEEANEGQFLARLSIAFDAFTISEVINRPTPEEAKQALNDFVISQARISSLMVLENLKSIKEKKDQETQSRYVIQQIMDAINPLVIWPARIEYPEE